MKTTSIFRGNIDNEISVKSKCAAGNFLSHAVQNGTFRFRGLLAAIIQDLGLRKIRFHDLRHTFASVLINNDVPLINVSRFLGHSDISTTANIYAHLDAATKADTGTAMSKALG